MIIKITPAPGTCCPDMKCICEGCNKDYTSIIWHQRREIELLKAFVHAEDIDSKKYHWDILQAFYNSRS